jgi:CSLREA domain-containing protein
VIPRPCPRSPSRRDLHVNSTADTDDGLCNAANCTLREAINAANAAAGADTIRFSIGSGPRTISPGAALPAVTDPVTIDGTTQPGFSGSPIIEIEGSSAPNGTNGLRVSAGSSLITGLVINRFKTAFPAVNGNGIQLDTAGGNEIRGCYIGTNIAGQRRPRERAARNPDHRVVEQPDRPDEPSNRINVISGNQGDGVHVEGGSSDNTIAGDRIGTNATGTGDLGNAINGVIFTAGTGNVVGNGIYGDTLVSGNGGDGVKMTTLSTGTVVQNCYIGTNAAGTAALGNDFQGVEITGNFTSGHVVGPSNVISGNVSSGVLIISGATGSSVVSNFVGTDATGAGGRRQRSQRHHRLGRERQRRRPRQHRVGQPDQRRAAAERRVEQRRQGEPHRRERRRSRRRCRTRRRACSATTGATGNTIGGPGADRNVISGNTGHGVLFLDATTAGNVLQGNFIGTNATASAGFPNAQGGVAIQGGANGNTIGGTAAGTKNVISANGGPGVAVESGSGQRDPRQHDLVQLRPGNRSRTRGRDAERRRRSRPGRQPAAELPGAHLDRARRHDDAGAGLAQQPRGNGLSPGVLRDARLRRLRATGRASASSAPPDRTTDAGGKRPRSSRRSPRPRPDPGSRPRPRTRPATPPSSRHASPSPGRRRRRSRPRRGPAGGGTALRGRRGELPDRRDAEDRRRGGRRLGPHRLGDRRRLTVASRPARSTTWS